MDKCKHLWGIRIKYEHGDTERLKWAKLSDGRLLNHYSLRYTHACLCDIEKEFNTLTHELWIECFECGEIIDV